MAIEDNSAEDQMKDKTSQPLAGTVVMPGSDSSSPSATVQDTTNITPPPGPSESSKFSANKSIVGRDNIEESIDKDNYISWSGPEYINHEKTNNWHFFMFLSAFAVAGLLYLITSDIITTVTIFICIVSLGVYSLKRPKNKEYKLNKKGIYVGVKSFTYDDFRSFSVSHEGGYLSINLVPLKRFSPLVGMFYQGDNEEQIVNFLSDRLPLAEHKLDIIESFMQAIHF